MPIEHNQSWDIEGNLVVDEFVEVPETETPKLEDIAQSAGVDVQTLLSQVQQFLEQKTTEA